MSFQNGCFWNRKFDQLPRVNRGGPGKVGLESCRLGFRVYGAEEL